MNIEFKTLTLNDIIAMKPYFSCCKWLLSDYSAAFKFMWQKHFAIQFAYVCDCVVFREIYQGRTYFHFPMELEEGNAKKAVDVVEDYCREKNIRIHFTCVPREKMDCMLDRYGMEMRITNHRRWRDYLYNAEDFINYPGKKFSGQRNHVNKFKRLFPQYKFIQLCGDDRAIIHDFLKKYEIRQLSKGTVIAKEELESVYDLLPYIDELSLLVGAIEVDGEIIAVSMGEKCGDQLIVHVEKALTGYDGVYPVMASEFAAHYARDVKYINREDDAGDPGLRKSKLQYNPVRLIEKYDIFPRRIIDRVSHLPSLATSRLTIKEITDVDSLGFFKLEYDADRNKYWGYNWREHFDGEPTADYFMQAMREDFKNRDEMPMGIYLGPTFIGEVVLHNFGYRGDCEVGVRLLPEFEGQGYAQEAVLGAMHYAFFELNVEAVRAKCYKQNIRSKNMLLSCGLRPCGEDDTFYYFRKTAAM